MVLCDLEGIEKIAPSACDLSGFVFVFNDDAGEPDQR